MHETTISFSARKKKNEETQYLFMQQYTQMFRERDHNLDMHSYMQGYSMEKQEGYSTDMGEHGRTIMQFTIIIAFSVKVGCMSMSVSWNEPNERDGDEN